MLDALIGGFVGAGLPLAVAGVARPRPRVGLAVPLPRGATAEADLVELFLADRRPVDEVRQAVTLGLPEGVRLVAIEDEWIGAPSLASRVAAVVYRADVEADGPAPPPSESSDPWMRVVEWDEDAGRGTLALRFAKDAAGRFGKPSEAIAALRGPRLVRLVRASVELAGE